MALKTRNEVTPFYHRFEPCKRSEQLFNANCRQNRRMDGRFSACLGPVAATLPQIEIACIVV